MHSLRHCFDESGPDGLGAARDRYLRRSPLDGFDAALHPSVGRDLADEFNRRMAQVHAWRDHMLTQAGAVEGDEGWS